jgi:hypothetical protein
VSFVLPLEEKLASQPVGPIRYSVSGGEGAVVVREPVGALHGTARQDRLRAELLWYATHPNSVFFII